MSGHSKWAQIKHKKAITDAKKGQRFSKMIREIAVAAAIGNPSPETNIRLRAAIEHARAEGVPKDNIERVLAKASGKEENTNLKEFLYEVAAPGGVAMLIEGITNNTNRTFGELKHMLSEKGARIVEPGSLIWSFEKVGVLEVEQEKAIKKTREEVELAIIESGARNFQTNEQAWIIETDFTQREKVRHALEAKGIPVREAAHDYKPQSTATVDPEATKQVELLLNALLGRDDVQEVYTNIKPLTQ